MYNDMGKMLDSTICSDEIVVFFFMYIDIGKKLESTFCSDEIVVFSLFI